MTKSLIPVCPTCGQKAIRQETRYGTRYACCRLWAWGNHPLVDAETHKARNDAHAAFDQIWKSGLLKRSYAYACLSNKLGISAAECHMKLMDKETAAKVPQAATEIMRECEGKSA